jgi:hypothetical protein
MLGRPVSHGTLIAVLRFRLDYPRFLKSDESPRSLHRLHFGALTSDRRIHRPITVAAATSCSAIPSKDLAQDCSRFPRHPSVLLQLLFKEFVTTIGRFSRFHTVSTHQGDSGTSTRHPITRLHIGSPIYSCRSAARRPTLLLGVLYMTDWIDQTSSPCSIFSVGYI